MNSLEKLKALDEERAKVLEQARMEALHKAQDAIKELSELGFHYSLVEGPHHPIAGKAQQTAHRTVEVAKVEPWPSGYDQTLPGS